MINLLWQDFDMQIKIRNFAKVIFLRNQKTVK